MTLFVADRSHGLLLFDISKPTMPTPIGSVDVSGLPRWVSVENERLLVLVEGFDVDEQQAMLRLQMYDLKIETAPEELDRLELRGGFRSVRPVDGGVVVLTDILEEVACNPNSGTGTTGGFWVPTKELQLTAVSTAKQTLEAKAELSVEGDGFVELPEGVAITLGPERQTQSLRFVEIGSEGELQASGKVEFEQSVSPAAPMQWVEGRLRVFESAGRDSKLTEIDLAEPAERRSIELPLDAPPGRPFGSFSGTAFSGQNALVSVSGLDESGAAYKARVVSFATEAPEVTHTFERPIHWFFPLEKTSPESPTTQWLGFSQVGQADFELVRFRLSAAGSVEVTGSLELPESVVGASWGPPLVVDITADRALVPYRAAASRDGLLIGSVELSDAMRWQNGSAATVAGVPASPRELGTDWFWLNPFSERQPVQLAGLVGLGTEDEPELVVMTTGADLQAIASAGDNVAAIERRGEQVLLTLDQGDSARDLELEHEAATLSFRGDQILAGTLGTQGDCDVRGSDCTQEPFQFSVVDPKKSQILGTFELPRVDVKQQAELSATIEWMEVVHTREGAGLLQRRGYSCRSQTACEDNDIPFEWETDHGSSPMEEDGAGGTDVQPVTTQRAQGQIDEMWLYPINLLRVSLAKPRRLARLHAYEFVTALDFVQQTGFSLLAARDVQHHEGFGGIESARLSLLTTPAESDAAAVLRGWPVATLKQQWTEAPVAITMEPAGSDESNEDALHQLVLGAEQTYLRDTLHLKGGYKQHAWAKQQGYVLSQSADPCAKDRSTQVTIVQSDEAGLSQAGTLEVKGHGWRMRAQSDKLLLLQQSIAGLNRLVVVNTEGEPEPLLERVLGSSWFSARQAAIEEDRVLLTTRSGGLLELKP